MSDKFQPTMLSGFSTPAAVFSDVDGTLVDTEHHPISEDAPVVASVAQRVPFCLVSARSPEGLYPIQRGLNFTGPIVCFSGAYVLDADGHELWSQTIDLSDALEIKDYLSHDLPKLCVGTYGFHDWIVDDRSDPRIEREEYYVQANSRQSSDLASIFAGRGIHKFLVMGEPDPIREAERVISSRFPQLSVVRSHPTLCEIMAADVTKAAGINLLCHYFNIDPALCVAFGDGYNDLEMLNAVGTSYAMANAAPAVKDAATHIIKWTNSESGVARTLKTLFSL